MRLFYGPRVHLKLFRRRFSHWFPIDSFCKHCGRDVRDFDAPDDVWEQIEPHIRHGYTLCYDCFCNYCGKLGLPTVWKLSDMRATHILAAQERDRYKEALAALVFLKDIKERIESGASSPDEARYYAGHKEAAWHRARGALSTVSPQKPR